MTTSPKIIRLSDYQPPAYKVADLFLNFEIFDEHTLVTAVAHYEKQRDVALSLNGEHLELVEVRLDGEVVKSDCYILEDDKLILHGLPDQFTLAIKTKTYPHKNTALEGLYQSNGVFCTQCEAEGFRRITYFQDRPDVLTIYKVRIEAESKYPKLLSNGNLIESGTLGQNRHFALWEDPHPKPCYLFALVVGDLGLVRDTFTTMNGKEIGLEVYTEHHNIDKCDFALASLKASMAWDEQRFGREYDLDVYMIVAVEDFNMGAMENKGLNIFNTKYVLASVETATDADYEGIEAVIGHEYFHNWSGNRVTCRDWFQLSLKEGFTVFRDEEFTSDLRSRAVKRIEDVNILRNYQFPEDAGPMAHPVQPQSYIEINNFYTVTVYNKGAEVVRMYHTLLGESVFRRGCDIYFERYDGQAVTVEEFTSAMEIASGRDLTQFRRWYSQAGTPTVEVRQECSDNRVSLHFKQQTADTSDGSEKKPFHIPIRLGLLDELGKELIEEQVIELTEAEMKVSFNEVFSTQVTPSLLRGFSAPVNIHYHYTDNERLHLMQHDSDSFNAWEAGQALLEKIIFETYDAGGEVCGIEKISAALAALLSSEKDPALIALMLKLPLEKSLQQARETINPVQLYLARHAVQKTLANTLYKAIEQRYEQLAMGAYCSAKASIAKRSLRNQLMMMMCSSDQSRAFECAFTHYDASDNMTDRQAALTALVHNQAPQAEMALDDFYNRFQSNALVMDKWLMIQSTAGNARSLSQVKSLYQHKAFNDKNPNKLRALVGGFAHQNTLGFHAEDGSGYAFVVEEVIRLSEINPQVASRLVSSFNQWKRFDEKRQEMMRSSLEKILSAKDLAKDVYEISQKALQ